MDFTPIVLVQNTAGRLARYFAANEYSRLETKIAYSCLINKQEYHLAIQ